MSEDEYPNAKLAEYNHPQYSYGFLEANLVLGIKYLSTITSISDFFFFRLNGNFKLNNNNNNNMFNFFVGQKIAINNKQI